MTRLNQLIEAQAMSINNSARPTPRCGDADPHHELNGSINGANDYRNHEAEDQDQQQMDYNEALASLASVITKIASQVHIRSGYFFFFNHMCAPA